MPHTDIGRIADEAGGLLRAGADPLSVAIHVEEACGIVLPDALITAEHLGTPEAIVRTVGSLSGAG